MTKPSPIKTLRAIGGEWTAELIGFAYYRYTGQVNGHTVEVQRFAHSTMHVNGCDDWYSMWHAKVDGVHHKRIGPTESIRWLARDIQHELVGVDGSESRV